MPFFARIVSGGDEPVEMTITDVSVTVDGVTRVLLDEPASLTVNTADSVGDTGPSAVAFSRSVDGKLPAMLDAVGNANVVIGAPAVDIGLAGGSKKMKASSAEGLWATAKVGRQRSTGTHIFELYFGVAGRAEPIDQATGQKSRAHLSWLFGSEGGVRVRV